MLFSVRTLRHSRRLASWSMWPSEHRRPMRCSTALAVLAFSLSPPLPLLLLSLPLSLQLPPPPAMCCVREVGKPARGRSRRTLLGNYCSRFSLHLNFSHSLFLSTSSLTYSLRNFTDGGNSLQLPLSIPMTYRGNELEPEPDWGNDEKYGRKCGKKEGNNKNVDTGEEQKKEEKEERKRTRSGLRVREEAYVEACIDGVGIGQDVCMRLGDLDAHRPS